MNRLKRMKRRVNDYEQAFANWLVNNGVKYVAVDQQKRAMLRRNKIKSFDFLLYPSSCGDVSDNSGWPRADEPALIVTEVKGRIFKGKSLEKMSGLQCWVTMEDVRGLLRWQERFDGPYEKAKAMFVFAFRFELPCVEADGREVYDFNDRQYVFYAVDVDDYLKNMKVRSPRWQTVMLSAEKFRQLSVPVRSVLFKNDSEMSLSYV